ncbi:MAG: phosphogluconate dehydratase [Gammaproteobacteria bacterium]|nr:phosphogluconate dehydratase [Gammaproteobacteria bacterium]MDH3768241.1 phosphogluconate dehydratase [Gammaproteobacteria bacterium]
MALLNSVIEEVTERIRRRSGPARKEYLRNVESWRHRGPRRSILGCTNLAHGYAAVSDESKTMLRKMQQHPNIAIVSAYNDMLSAHQPLRDFPEQIKQTVLDNGATAQFAGGVPAMCDGVTQGQPGMELSLFSRDVITLATAVALSHEMFDGALMLGVCDKIVPGLLIAALRFGHLPTIFVPAGPMSSGISNSEKARTRELYAEGKIDRDELLLSEEKSYHGPGTCTFYGTANSNQMLMEIMGLHVPGAAFFNPYTPMRSALTAAAAKRITEITALGDQHKPIGRVVDERSIVNAIVGLLATGGSTNHTIHLIAIAAAAGITVDWDDFGRLSSVTPLLARIYPNGKADVNHFHAAGGLGCIIRQLLEAGLLHEDVETVMGDSLEDYAREPIRDGAALVWRDSPATGADNAIIATVENPFHATGGIRVLEGNLGRAIYKTSAIPPDRLVVEAPARVFNNQEAVLEAFRNGEFSDDVVVVVCFQGPGSNGMPELHKLSPPLGALQEQGLRVALVTDGRMSGASGKFPAAIHVSPECVAGGPLARVCDGDIIRVDGENGQLAVRLSERELAARSPGAAPDDNFGLGRELFEVFRQAAGQAEMGASSLINTTITMD